MCVFVPVRAHEGIIICATIRLATPPSPCPPRLSLLNNFPMQPVLTARCIPCVDARSGRACATVRDECMRTCSDRVIVFNNSTSQPSPSPLHQPLSLLNYYYHYYDCTSSVFSRASAPRTHTHTHKHTRARTHKHTRTRENISRG